MTDLSNKPIIATTTATQANGQQMMRQQFADTSSKKLNQQLFTTNVTKRTPLANNTSVMSKSNRVPDYPMGRPTPNRAKINERKATVSMNASRSLSPNMFEASVKNSNQADTSPNFGKDAFQSIFKNDQNQMKF